MWVDINSWTHVSPPLRPVGKTVDGLVPHRSNSFRETLRLLHIYTCTNGIRHRHEATPLAEKSVLSSQQLSLSSWYTFYTSHSLHVHLLSQHSRFVYLTHFVFHFNIIYIYIIGHEYCPAFSDSFDSFSPSRSVAWAPELALRGSYSHGENADKYMNAYGEHGNDFKFNNVNPMNFVIQNDILLLYHIILYSFAILLQCDCPQFCHHQ